MPQPSIARLAAAEQLADPLLQRMVRQPIARERPAVRAAGGEHTGVLAGAVVPELSFRPALLRPVLEVVDRRARAREQRAHRVELRGLGLVRCARDRELVVVEVVVGLGERHRLDRLRRRAKEADDVVAVQHAVGRGDVDAVDGLDDVPAPHDYPEWVHRRSVRARIARGRGLAAPARRRRQALPDRAGRAGAHRDAEDVRPAALGARGRRARGRAAPREAAPLPDRRRRARPDGAPDERGAAPLPEGRREGAEDARVPAALHRRRRARAHRGRGEEARRRLAAAARTRSRPSSRTSARRPTSSTRRRSRRSSPPTRAGSTRCCATSG